MSLLLIGLFELPFWAPLLKSYDPRVWVPRLWQDFRYDPFANLREADLSRAGAGSTPASLEDSDLSGASLEGASAENVDFRHANLSLARLDNARLMGADFEGANLYGTSFYGADLTAANLKGANLIGADIGRAKGLIRPQVESARAWFFARPALVFHELRSDLRGQDLAHLSLRNFDLRGADLRGADLTLTDLTSADLTGARLFLTRFFGAKVRPEQVRSMRGWQLGFYDPALEQQLGLPRNHYDKLLLHRVSGDLRNADLLGMDLQHWSFAGADLEGADLRSSKLALTNFRGARNVNPRQFTSFQTQLAFWDDELLRVFGLPNDHNERLARCDFRGAMLQGCNLHGSALAAPGCDFTAADLRRADLTQAFMSGTLHDAKLDGANLLLAFIGSSKGLTATQVKRAKNWEFAILPDTLELLPSDPGHRSRLSTRYFQAQTIKADLSGADFSDANFRGAHLSGSSFAYAELQRVSFAEADLNSVSFYQADLRWADFRRAKNLTPAQIRDARDWTAAYLDPSLLADLGLPANHNETLDRLATFLNIRIGTGRSPY